MLLITNEQFGTCIFMYRWLQFQKPRPGYQVMILRKMNMFPSNVTELPFSYQRWLDATILHELAVRFLGGGRLRVLMSISRHGNNMKHIVCNRMHWWIKHQKTYMWLSYLGLMSWKIMGNAYPHGGDKDCDLNWEISGNRVFLPSTGISWSFCWFETIDIGCRCS